ncbi:MAG: hypothetical protein Q8N03_14670, partial [Ignavibacteria bacterium]|nr:hypothetical protein [Ignavibacteria bacterium]
SDFELIHFIYFFSHNFIQSIFSQHNLVGLYNGVANKALPNTTKQNLQANADNYLLTHFVNYTQRAIYFYNYCQ